MFYKIVFGIRIFKPLNSVEFIVKQFFRKRFSQKFISHAAHINNYRKYTNIFRTNFEQVFSMSTFLTTTDPF